MKTYKGYTDRGDTGGGVIVLVFTDGQVPYRLRHLIVHSPSGMNWGYNGSGPADLALALLADHLGEAAAIPAHDRYIPAIAGQVQRTQAWLLHQEFKRDHIAPLAQDRGFTLTSADVDTWLAPRLAEAERVVRERHMLDLIGQRVALADGTIVDVLDVADEVTGILLVDASGHSSLHRTVPASDVARVLGTMADDDGEGAA